MAAWRANDRDKEIEWPSTLDVGMAAWRANDRDEEVEWPSYLDDGMAAWRANDRDEELEWPCYLDDGMAAWRANDRDEEVEWPCYLDDGRDNDRAWRDNDRDEDEKFLQVMNPPMVGIDNNSSPTATLITVDSTRNHRYLLEIVQLFSDLDLSIKEAYFSCEEGFFLDVFHVTDQFGCKLKDKGLISYIQETLETLAPNKPGSQGNLTVFELSGTDCPGLLSEIFAVLADLRCAIPDALVWTQNGWMAAVLLLSDEDSGEPINDDQLRICLIKTYLRKILQVQTRIASMAFPNGERRLHQMMFAHRDFETASSPPAVSVHSLVSRGYSLVTVQCSDRPKLLFDIVCTLTDMNYVIFHATVRTDADQAFQEFYIKHSDGKPICTKEERQRVIQCLQEAVERRSRGLRLEIFTEKRKGLLSHVTKVFRDNGLLVKSAEVSTNEKMMLNVFYVTDAAGDIPSSEMVASIQRNIGTVSLTVKEPEPRICEQVVGVGEAESKAGSWFGTWFGLASLGRFLLRNLCKLGFIRSLFW